MQSAVEMQLAYQNLQTIIQRLWYKAFIKILALAISSQKNTLIGILRNISLILKKKGLIFFGQKLVVSAIVQHKNNTKQTTNRAKFFSVKLQQHKNNSIFLCKSIYIAYLIYEFFCTLCFFKYICFFSYGCFLNSNYSKQQIVILVI